MQKDRSVARTDCEKGNGCLAPVVKGGAWLVCKALTVLDPLHIGLLRRRGKYKKVTTLKLSRGLAGQGLEHPLAWSKATGGICCIMWRRGKSLSRC